MEWTMEWTMWEAKFTELAISFVSEMAGSVDQPIAL